MAIDEPVVSVGGGRIRGRTSGGVTRFLGIPYAAPVVGPARFRLPEPVAPWSGIRDASEHGPAAPQLPYPRQVQSLLGVPERQADDCLNLSVWTPDPSGAGLPVMVWIHGGAFTRGANSYPLYDGTAFARDGVVLVSINYRLGMPGFAVLPDAPHNRGLHDQLFALRWVRENIAAFGGDPDNVTVFGESAGAISVACLLAAESAHGLFHRAILQSGNASAVATTADSARVTAAAAQLLGVRAGAAEFGALPSERLLAAQAEVGANLAADPDPARWGASVISGGSAIMSMFPVIDGDLVSGVPLDVLAAAPGRCVPLLVGTNAEEFRLFAVPMGLAGAIDAQTLPLLLDRAGIGPGVLAKYRHSEAKPGDLYCEILTDRFFREPARLLAAAVDTCYRYEFTWPTEVLQLGSCHALELPFVFDTLAVSHQLTGDHPPQHLADEIHSAWVSFATDGDPGWPVREADAPVLRSFGTSVVSH
ncbi:carboxylesterase/lipase family protein [Nocardia sp. NPDC127579]|uniref:carboxylesterase/lipase family protein n=1 Tax=Nocardia sp. NPDC127579 TaxID=3345402 RepID=UPI00362B1E94